MSSPELKIDVEQAEGHMPVTIIRIEGSIDAATYPRVQARVDDAYTAGARYVLFDLANVDYVSSAGLRVLLRLNDQLNNERTAEGGAQPRGNPADMKSRHVKLLNPSKNVRRLLEVAGFVQFLEIYTDQDTALASFS